MTPSNRDLLAKIKPLLRAGHTQRAIAAKLNVTPGRVLGIVYRHVDKVPRP